MPTSTYTALHGNEFTVRLGGGASILLGDTVSAGRTAEQVGKFTVIGYHTTLHTFLNLEIPANVRIKSAKFEITASAPTHNATRDLRLAIPARDGKWNHKPGDAAKFIMFRTSNVVMDDQGAGLMSVPDQIDPIGNGGIDVVGPDPTDATTNVPVSPVFFATMKCDTSGTLTSIGVSLIPRAWTGSMFLIINEVLSSLPIARGASLAIGPNMGRTTAVNKVSWTDDPTTPFTFISSVEVTAGKFYVIQLGLTTQAKQIFDYAKLTVNCTNQPTHAPLADGTGCVRGVLHRSVVTHEGLYQGYSKDGMVPTTTRVAGENPALVPDNTFEIIGNLTVPAFTWVDGTKFSWGSTEHSPTVEVDLVGALQNWVEDADYTPGEPFALMVDSLPTDPVNPLTYEYYPAFDVAGASTGNAPTLTISYELWVPPPGVPTNTYDEVDTDPSSSYTVVHTDPSSTYATEDTDPSSSWDAEDTVEDDPDAFWFQQYYLSSIDGDPNNLCLDPIELCFDPILICGATDYAVDPVGSAAYVEVDTDPSSAWDPSDTTPATPYDTVDTEHPTAYDTEDADPASSWDAAFEEDC